VKHLIKVAYQARAVIFTVTISFMVQIGLCQINANFSSPNPVANFTVDNTEGCAPVIVNFSDNSTSQNGDIISWLWDVGGSAGVVSQTSASDFSSTYGIQGSYTASLTVVDEQGCTVTTTRPNAVIASTLITPDIRIDLTPTCELPWEVTFTNQNSDPLIQYTWDFGNGETFMGLQPPSIMYSEVGVYDVTVYMESGDCKDTVVLKNFVDTNSPAAFSFSPNVICQDNPVQFTDISLNDADQVLWNFGDGFTSTDANPSHVYSSPGCFDVTLIRTVGTCLDTVVLSCVSVLDLPSVSYDITNQYSCTLPADIILHAESSSSGSIEWEFINDGVVTDYNTNDVEITIEEFGLYYAVLHFESTAGCATTVDSIPIDIAPFEANVPVAGIGGCAPLSFTLSDSISSIVDIVSYNWSIGNPVEYISNQSSPSFTIPDTGRYDLQLIAENIYGCIDTFYMEDYIQVGDRPTVDFSGTPLAGCVEVDKYFTSLSSDFADSWQWFFGHDGYSEEQNPVFTFGDPGFYDVALHVSHNGCTDSLRFENYVTIFEPVSRFVIDYNCDDPYTVNIENRSIGADSLFWTLHLSDTEVLTFTDSVFGQYTLPDRGDYPITHYSKSFDTECEHTFEDTIRIVDPIASYVVDTLRGCAPFTIEIGNFSQDAVAYEFISDVANIDSIFNEEPKITFNEGGILTGPLLIITDIHECRDSFQLFDSVQVNKLEANINFTDVICVPDVAEFEDASTDVLGNIISWDWNIKPVGFSSSEQNTSLYIDSVGLYDLYFNVVDDWGCTDSIFMPQAINAIEVIPDFSYDSLGCAWAPINFTALGQNGSTYTYEWDFGDGNTSTEQNPSYTYSEEGMFSVCLTMIDIRGCGKTTCKENIVEISNPVAQLSGDPTSATCPPLLTNFENQSINATSYQWDFGDNSGKTQTESPSHVYTSPGRYDLTLIAESTPTCIDTLFLPEYIRVEGPVGEFVADVAPTCLPVNVKLNAISDDYYRYVWDLGNGILDSVAGFVIEDSISYVYNQPGRYTPKLIITDSSGCTRSFAGQPIELDLVTLDFTMDSDPICGPPLAVSLENISFGTTDDVDFHWLVTGVDNYESTDKNPTFDIQQTGQYSVSLIGQYGSCVDTLTINDFMEVAEIPEVEFEIMTEELCEDVKVSFQNNSSIGYGEFETWVWDFGDGNFSNEMNPSHQYQGLESQTITLTGITDKGCEASFSASFDVLPSTVATVADDKLICIGDQIEIVGSIENLQPDGDFYWESEGILTCTNCLSQVVMPTETTSYILVGVHPNGCESRDTIEVVVIPTPGPELTIESDSIICLGNESIINVVNFNQDYTYEWNTSVPGQDCYQNCEIVNISPEEITTYFVTVYNEFGCFKEDSITVDVESSIEDFLVNEAGICYGDQTTIGITGGNNPSWTPDPEIQCESCTENTVSPLITSTYHVSVQSDLGCNYRDSIDVVVVPSNSADAGLDAEICLGESTSLTSTGYGTPSWTGDIAIADPNDTTISVMPLASQYVYLNMNFYECEQADSVFITVHLKAEIEAYGDTICPGEIALISADGRADDYLWTLGTNERNGSDIEVSPLITTEFPVIGSYRTCEPDTTEALVYVHPAIDYVIDEDFYNIFLNDQINISPSYDLDRNYSFDWVPEEGLDCSDCPDPIIKGITRSIDYNVLVVDDNTDCQIEQDIRVRFNNECTNSVFHLPNIFSPNKDGQNDFWRLYTNNPEEFISLAVFDRYGNFVFQTDDIETSWDGTFRGQDVVTGVYVYRVKLICPYDRKEYHVVGDVTIIR